MFTCFWLLLIFHRWRSISRFTCSRFLRVKLVSSWGSFGSCFEVWYSIGAEWKILVAVYCVKSSKMLQVSFFSFFNHVILLINYGESNTLAAAYFHFISSLIECIQLMLHFCVQGNMTAVCWWDSYREIVRRGRQDTFSLGKIGYWHMHHVIFFCCSTMWVVSGPHAL